MGITGLLPLLRSITKRVHIESLAGQAVAVDAYSWLHKGVYLCAHDLFHQKPTFGYVEYCVSKIKLLRKYNIRPILVFDGAPLPMKSGKESSRHKNRSESRQKANDFIEKGDHKSATVHIHKSIDVTPEMAYILIQELKLIGVDFVVAPYEADAQMAFLDRIGEVAAIITEDSDMLLFGCKKMLYKLDKNGFADEVNLEDIGETTDIELSGFTLERFRQMCILSGCDYLDAIPGFGLKTCHKYFVKYKTAERVLQAIRAEFPSKVPIDFESKFAMAELTFCHQRVYDHRCQELVHLYPLTEEMVLSDEFQGYGTWEFVGPHVECSIAKAVARGQLNPITKEPFEVEKENIDTQETQETLASQKVAPPKNAIRSRFFQPISKAQHNAMTEKRLSIRPAPHVNTSLHASPLRLARGLSTLPSKRLAENVPEPKRPGKTSKLPSFLYSNKRSTSDKSSGTSAQRPVRLDNAQTSLFSFLKRT